MKLKLLIPFLALLGSCSVSKTTNKTQKLSDDELLTEVQRQTYKYFYEGAEPTSGLARERYHSDNIYGKHDKDIIATGASGFGIMGTIVAIERKFITREQGYAHLKKGLDFLEKADRFHGAWAHWMHPSGKAKEFGKDDDAGDIVETSFLAQALVTLRQYYQNGNADEKTLAKKADELWKGIEWDFYRQNNKNVLYWHWSPKSAWKMNFAITGYNECLITYVMAACSPTHGVPAEVYHQGWAKNGAMNTDISMYGHPIKLKHNVVGESVGPLFWAHYSYLGLNPKGLKDKYADYWQENRNHTLINYDYAIANPKGFKGYGKNSWGMTASYSVKGYAAHMPNEDFGVISPTAALSSYPYTPKESMQMIRHLYENMKDKVWGEFGFYDAYSETANWYPKRYLGIDQGPIVVMIENGRTGLLWKLFMSAPEIQQGLTKLGFTYSK
ncbi:MAG: glucoamylase family protein [Pedobacter sp.]|uniref:glucoamylase family protein n=1 Tax=Pedobacter sp. TaxID=1411316 RepID=UPI002808126F|nr:glucoamylase family protein [Pedobacter sp.]MDQ8005200.1 glucoamylase family protein [Pedobacter sp.]